MVKPPKKDKSKAKKPETLDEIDSDVEMLDDLQSD